MVRQHHQLNARESEQTLGDSEGAESVMLQSMDRKELDTTWCLNNKKMFGLKHTSNGCSNLLTLRKVDCSFLNMLHPITLHSMNKSLYFFNFYFFNTKNIFCWGIAH